MNVSVHYMEIREFPQSIIPYFGLTSANYHTYVIVMLYCDPAPNLSIPGSFATESDTLRGQSL